MMGWFMIEINASEDIYLHVFYDCINIESYAYGLGMVVYNNEIDDLIAALQKAKAIMAIDKSK